MKLLVAKDDFVWLQKQGFLKNPQTVDDIWTKLVDRCPVKEVSKLSNIDYHRTIPTVKGTFKYTPNKNHISIVYSRNNGSQLASTIESQMTKLINRDKLNFTVSRAYVPECKEDYRELEQSIAESKFLVVLLTSNALKDAELVFAMQAAKVYFPTISQVILVHDAGSCFFPSYDEQPDSVEEFFSEKAITMLHSYLTSGVKQILNKCVEESVAIDTEAKNKFELAKKVFNDWSIRTVTGTLTVEDAKRFISESINQSHVIDMVSNFIDPNKNVKVEINDFCDLLCNIKELKPILESYSSHSHTEDLTTTLFLSHKRSTGQGIAGRLYEGLKNDYSIFLDSEAKFKIHNLQEIVKHTRVFLFILSPGIFQSQWCLEEFKSAISYKKKIIIIRDLSFSMPEVLPVEWQDSLGKIMKETNQLVWMAEYNADCIKELKKMIGPSDKHVKEAQEWIKSNPSFFDEIRSSNQITIPPSVKLSALRYLYPNSTELQCPNIVFNENAPSRADIPSSYPITHLTIQYPAFRTSKDNSLTDSRLTQIFKLEHPLKYLNLSGCDDISDKSLERVEFGYPSLENLNISSCFNLTDEGMKHIAKGCPNLSHLNLSKCKITDQGIIAIIQSCKKIKHLDISSCKVSNQLIDTIVSTCNELQFINLSSCKSIDDSALMSIKNIQGIGLSSCDQITDAGLQGLATNCPSLQYLTLSMSKVTDQSLEYIGKGCPNLHHLDLSLCKGITDNGLLSIVNGGSKLEHLNVSYCKSVTDTGLQAILKNSPQLQYLNVKDCSTLTDSAFVDIGKLCPQLHHLDMGSCKITDAALQHFGRGTIKLTNLDLAFCKGITDQGIQHLDLSAAQALDFPYTSVSDQCLDCIGKESQGLQHLNLKGCGKLTDNGVKCVASGCSKLQYVCLAGCKQVTTQAHQTIRDSCKLLRKLDVADDDYY